MLMVFTNQPITWGAHLVYLRGTFFIARFHRTHAYPKLCEAQWLALWGSCAHAHGRAGHTRAVQPRESGGAKTRTICGPFHWHPFNINLIQCKTHFNPLWSQYVYIHICIHIRFHLWLFTMVWFGEGKGFIRRTIKDHMGADFICLLSSSSHVFHLHDSSM